MNQYGYSEIWLDTDQIIVVGKEVISLSGCDFGVIEVIQTSEGQLIGTLYPWHRVQFARIIPS